MTIGKTNITLSANAKDADGNLRELQFRFWKVGGTVPAAKIAKPNSSGTATVQIPVTFPLADKTTYSWDVRAVDTDNAASSYFPPGSEPCRITIDATAPPQPEIESEDFPEATSDGLTWAKAPFGTSGKVTLVSSGATRFRYAIEGLQWFEAPASSGRATVTLAPAHAGPNWLLVHAYDATGNQSVRTDYAFYVPPRDEADKPWDTTGDGIPDLLIVDAVGKLMNCVGSAGGELYGCLGAAYTKDTRTGKTKLHPANHWFDPSTGKAALITHWADAFRVTAPPTCSRSPRTARRGCTPVTATAASTSASGSRSGCPRTLPPPRPGRRSRRSATSPATVTPIWCCGQARSSGRCPATPEAPSGRPR